MDFLLLGPMEARDRAVPVSLGRRQERCLLGLLLLESGRVVGIDRLLDLLWDGNPPVSARGAVHTYTGRLRTVLNQHGVTLTTRGDGYQIDVAPAAVDVHRFTTAVGEAQRLTDPAQRAAILADAMALWRGPLLADVADEGLRQRVGGGLEELRVTAAELHAEAWLGCGQPERAIADLVDLTRRHPTRERLTGLLMTAFYRSGRQVDALATYRAARQVLATDYGVEPGRELRQLHDQVLRDDPELLSVSAPVTAARPAPLQQVPPERATPSPPPRPAEPAGAEPEAPGRMLRTLPRDVPEFTGRAMTLATIRASLTGRASATAPVLIAIDGMAGVGKTALALRFAHTVSDMFPDGQFYVDLHGHSEDEPLSPAVALDTLLRQIGVRGDRIPEGLAERAALWRTTLAPRRVLIVADNAAGTDQVTPLLPASAGCLVLVTSRRRLVGLDGARPFSLDLLTHEESVALLRTVVGERIDADPAAADEIAQLCGHLALALRLAAARLVHRPTWRAADLAEQLRRSTPRRHLLGGEGRSVAAAFDLSYAHLSPAGQRMFRLLGLHPGEDLGESAAAALAGVSTAEASLALEELLDSHLVQEPTPGRYRLHDLLRDYAAGLADVHESEAGRDEALRRLYDFFIANGIPAAKLSSGLTSIVLADIAAPHGPTEDLATQAQSHRWFNSEYPNLLALIRYAAARSRHYDTYVLTRVTWYHQVRTSHTFGILETHELALAAARAMEQLLWVAELHNYLAWAKLTMGRPDEAHRDIVTAYETALAGGAPAVTLVKMLNNRVLVELRLGRPEAALDAGNLSMELMPAGDVLLRARTTGVIADIFEMQYRFEDAIAAWRAAARDLRTPETRFDRGMAMSSLGGLEVARGRYRVAIRLLHRALVLRGYSGSPDLEARRYKNLGLAHLGLGELETALSMLGRALEIAISAGDRLTESDVRRCFGDALLAVGDEAGAMAEYRTAVALATEAQAPREHALALDRMGCALQTSDPAAARAAWQRACAVLKGLKLPEHEMIAERLAAAGPQ